MPNRLLGRASVSFKRFEAVMRYSYSAVILKNKIWAGSKCTFFYKRSHLYFMKLDDFLFGFGGFTITLK
ncbi:hypothetical protein [Acinetobacter johnsonii]|uniref:hypothetical protein n=1 Tax=Acinetobacter johnsonii TaxID=40214 RepID=UPI00191D231E|nr:hypothetical protein [Acinetobacter johnsonii]